MALLPVDGYRVYFYGGEEGYKSTRANINLLNSKGNIMGVIKFHGSGHTFGEDYVSEDIVWMHLPFNMLTSVVDLLRNEKPIFVHFAANRAILSTSEEPIGEGDDDMSA